MGKKINNIEIYLNNSENLNEKIKRYLDFSIESLFFMKLMLDFKEKSKKRENIEELFQKYNFNKDECGNYNFSFKEIIRDNDFPKTQIIENYYNSKYDKIYLFSNSYREPYFITNYLGEYFNDEII